MKSFKAEEFIIDLNCRLQSYCNIHNQDTDVNEDVSRITETFIKTLNSHAPLRPPSRRERKLNEKPYSNLVINVLKQTKLSFIKNIATSLRM